MVPHIALPSLAPYMETTTEQAEATEEVREQVHLLSLDASSGTAQEIVRGEPSTYSTRTGPFHLFQCTATLLPQKLHLLHILRPVQIKKGKSAASRSASYALTDELAFSLIYRHPESNQPSVEQEASIQPGSTRIIIQFDEENIPTGYSVDGVEG